MDFDVAQGFDIQWYGGQAMTLRDLFVDVTMHPLTVAALVPEEGT